CRPDRPGRDQAEHRPEAGRPEGGAREQSVARRGRDRRRRRRVPGCGQRAWQEGQGPVGEEMTFRGMTRRKETAMRAERIVGGAAVAVAAVLTAGTVGVAALHAQNSQPHTLVMAVYNGQDTASQVFKTMTSAQGDTGERIQAYAVVSKD